MLLLGHNARSEEPIMHALTYKQAGTNVQCNKWDLKATMAGRQTIRVNTSIPYNCRALVGRTIPGG